MANVTLTTAASFIPEIWTLGVDNYMRRSLVWENLVDSSLSGTVKAMGDTFRIPKLAEDSDAAKAAGTEVTFAANTHGSVSLVIDQHRYSAKLIDDIAKIQGLPGLFEKEVSGMGYSLAKTQDAYIESVCEGDTDGGATIGSDNTLTAAEVRAALVAMMNADIPVDQCNLVVSPDCYGSLLAISDFADASKFGAGQAPSYNGLIGRLYGMNVFTSSVMGSAADAGTEVAYCLHPSAISFARQAGPRVNSDYAVSWIGHRVVADILYGAVLVHSGRVYEFRNP